MAGDILLFCAALLIMSVFAVTSFPNAYLIALLALLVIVVAVFIYRRSRAKAD